MAKIRVYELAKELNIDSKILVKKLIASGLNVSNYMSTLDDEIVEKAKEIVYGKTPEVVEERRIKPTVIRRRKKVSIDSESEAEEFSVDEMSSPAEVIEPVAETTALQETPETIPPQVEQDDISLEASTEKEADDETQESKESEIIEEDTQPGADITDTEEQPVEPVETVDENNEIEEEYSPLEDAFEKEPESSTDDYIPGMTREIIDSERKSEGLFKHKKQKKKKSDKPAKIIKLPETRPQPTAPVTVPVIDETEKNSKIVVPKNEFKEHPETVFKKRGILPEDKIEFIDTPDEEKVLKKKKKEKNKAIKHVLLDDPENIKVRYHKKAIYERADLYQEREFSPKRKGKGGKKSKEETPKLKQTEITTPKAIKRRIKVQDTVTIQELAKAMGIKAVDLVKKLLALGINVNINQSIDYEVAMLAADEFGYELELGTFREKEILDEKDDRPEDLINRPPVVTIMGHVDHGKTSLLDYIRNTKVTDEESGGITQHIGAYHVKTEEGEIVFLDTPGHEAFTAMRARGAKVTDIIILVVAADDGVMPQTKEAINHAKAANIPIVLAINKIDKPTADPDKVKRELAALGLATEDWGGETIFGCISAKTGEGINEFLHLILLQAEMLELKGNPNKKARGAVIEAKLDKNKGPIATILINSGTLKSGDYFVCGDHFGRVRAMTDDLGKKLTKATPSIPVEIHGISGVPNAGDEFAVVEDERTAKQISEHRADKTKELDLAKKGINLESLFARIKEGDVKELNLVIKADVQGSLEALSESLLKQCTDEVKLKIIHTATGAITETDIMLATASNAIVIGFNVRANQRVTEIAKSNEIDIRYYDVIYNVIKDVRLAMTGLLAPVFKENVIGHARVVQTFRIPKIGLIAGSHVMDGVIERNANARLLRDNIVIYDGKISSLRRFKDDVKEVQSGYECGIGIDKYNDIKIDDIFEVYKIETLEAQL